MSVAEDYANPEASVTGLVPETTYFVRLRASNENGEIIQNKYFESGREVESVTTPTARPEVELPPGGSIRNVTDTSAHLEGNVKTDGSKTVWRFEYAQSVIGPWLVVPGAEGTVSLAEAQAHNHAAGVEGTLEGLVPGTTYYVRLFAENECAEGCGEGRNYPYGELVSTETRGFASVTTPGKPAVASFAVHGLHGEAVRVLGDVDPESVPTSEEQVVTVDGSPTGGSFTLTFAGHTTAAIKYDAPAEAAQGEESVEAALEALPGEPQVTVGGRAGGPYTVFFGGPEEGLAEPLMTAEGSGLTPSGSVSVTVAQQGGVAFDAYYHFQYVSQEQFAKPGGEGGFARASVTPEVDVGSGDTTRFVGADIPGLEAGETYRYRIVATNDSFGNPVVYGAEQSLTVPVPPVVGGPVVCPNEGVRTGPSANLPDCRGYERLTPADKEGAQEPFHYGPGVASGVLVGEDGDHVMLEDPAVNWGPGPGAGQSPYFFSRTGEGEWGMTAGSTPGETGVDDVVPRLYDSDLTQFAFEAFVHTAGGSGESKDIEYQVGPPGGPYTSVAAVPRSDVENNKLKGHDGWVASSRDFSKLILQVEDHTLLSKKGTGTTSGNDIYEYAEGRLSQVNVGVGECGADIVKGDEESGPGQPPLASSANAVSAEGSRVFFEAVPGSVCTEPANLYVRVDGQSTVDIGAYRFVAANAQGTQVLVEKRNGEAHELFLYTSESKSVKPLFVVHREIPDLRVSADFSAIYFESGERLTSEAPPVEEAGAADLYRYDLGTETLSFVAQIRFEAEAVLSVTPDGRYAYFQAEFVAGLPGGGVEHYEVEPGVESEKLSTQVYRYDSVEKVVECMSCASSFDPEPQLSSTFPGLNPEGSVGTELTLDGHPGLSLVSGNGEFAFFDTPAALVSSDVDGEITPSRNSNGEFPSSTLNLSPSSDVYEWREAGVDGCVQVQGCLALITSGRGGYLNLLLGSAEEGRDVFVYTGSQLIPSDNDTAGDIYDARIDGGTPPPSAGPVECEGDSCAAPFTPPGAVTPSSSTFHGTGNPPAAASTPATKAKAKPKKTKAKRKTRKKGKPKKDAKGSKGARKSDQRKGR